MIADSIPGLRKLTAEEKLQLAYELWEEASRTEEEAAMTAGQLDEAESRMAEFESAPETAKSWKSVKEDILSDRG